MKVIDRLIQKPATLVASVFAVVAIAAYLPRVLMLVDGLQWPGGLLSWVTNRDFANYWMAARMVLLGDHSDLFQQSVYFARMQAVFGPDYPIHNWGYPPHFLLVLWPLGFLDYKTALVVFLIVTLLFFLTCAWVFRRTYGSDTGLTVLVLVVSGYSLLMIDASQNGFLLAGLLLLGVSWMRSRPILAGIAFGFLTVKPQLGLLIPLLLVFDRNWRAIGWSALATLSLVGISAFLFGVSSWMAYLTETLAYQRSVMVNWHGIFLPMMPTVFGTVRTLGFSADVAYVCQWPLSILAAGAIVWLLRYEPDPLRRIFTITCGTFLVSPYAFNYDMGALAVCAAVLASKPDLSRRTELAVSIVAGLPAAVMNLGRSQMPIAPLLLAAALAMIIWDVLDRRRKVPTVAAPPARDSFQAAGS